MNYVFDFLTALLLVAAVQNVVLTGGYGSSEALRMASRPKGLVLLSCCISAFSVALSVICFFLEGVPYINGMSYPHHVLIYVGVLFVLYIAVCLVMKIFKAQKSVLTLVGISAINTLVLAVPLINYRSGFSLPEVLGVSLGAGIAFSVTVMLLKLGTDSLKNNPDIPEAFKGAPAMFIYTALLALGLCALSNNAVGI